MATPELTRACVKKTLFFNDLLKVPFSQMNAARGGNLTER
jgi:hypothetical protein